MPDDALYRRIALASAKWYMPLNRQLLENCEIRPLPREANSRDEVVIEFKPTIAFPAALSPRTVLGRNPSDLKGLFFSPLVVRLHYVAQLSTTDLRANIDAKHCRLSHALGTLCNLSAFVEILVTRMSENPELYERCKPTDFEVLAAFTYAALHDAFQGPFGHALDAIREELVGGAHSNRRLDKTLLNFIIGSALHFQENRSRREISAPPVAIEALCEVLESTITKPCGIDLGLLLRWISNTSAADHKHLNENETKRMREIGWLYELLEGPLDADRWDYLWRDTLHLGFTRDHALISELLRDFWADITVHWDGTQSRIAISDSLSKRLGSGFFMLRKNLYKNVYENPEKRVIDSMLIRCIYLGLLKRIPRPDNWGTHGEYLEFLINLVHITDSDLLAILEEIKNPILAHSARELRTYPAVRVFWQEVLREEELSTVVQFQKAKLDRFEYKGIFPPNWLTDADRKKEAGAEGALSDHLDLTLQILQNRAQVTNVVPIGADYLPSLLLHCSIMPKRPARVLQFERVMWRLVTKKLANLGIIEKISHSTRNVLAGASVFGFVISAEMVAELLDECPPFFISFPWISSFSEPAMQEMSREPSGGATICVRRDNRRGVLNKLPAELMPRTADSETYIAVAGYPLYITNDLNELEREGLEGATKWAITGLLQNGCCLALPREFVAPEYDSQIVDWLWPKIEKETRPRT